MIAAAVLGVAAPCAAEEAEELFEKGMAELRAGKTSTACPALRKSYRFEKRPATLFHLAECEEKAGAIATAALHYDEYLDLFLRLSPPEQQQEAERERLARERRDAMDADIPRVTFRLEESAPKGTTVTRRSSAVPDAVPVVLGVPVPIDPGEHWVMTEAPGVQRRDKRFFVEKRERKTIEVTVGAVDDAPKVVRYSRPIEPVPAMMPMAIEEGSGGRRLAMYLAGGLGVAGIAGGIAAGALTWSQKKVIDSNCRDRMCNKEGQEAADFAEVMSPLSTLGLSVGAVGLGVWAILFFTEPEAARIGQTRPPLLGGLPAPGVRLDPQRREAVAEARWSW